MIPAHFEQVLDASNTSRDVWADKGYQDQEREARLNTMTAGAYMYSAKPNVASRKVSARNGVTLALPDHVHVLSMCLAQ